MAAGIARAGPAQRWLREARRRTESYLIVLVVVLFVFLAIATKDFFTLRNIVDTIGSYAFIATLACGLFLVLIAGGIDISFAANASITQYVMGVYISSVDSNWLEAFVIASAVGVAIGLFNAVLIYSLRAHSVIITIANQSLLFGLLMWATKGRTLANLPQWYGERVSAIDYVDESGSVYSLSLPILIMLAAFGLTYFILNRTAIGRQIYAMGGNPEGARRVGSHIFGLHLFVYGYMGLMAGIAGIIQSHRVDKVVPSALVGQELDVLAAVVLGGASLMGGVGTVLGTALGIGLLAILQNGLTLIGVSSYWFDVFTGALITGSVCLTAYADKLKAMRRGRHD